MQLSFIIKKQQGSSLVLALIVSFMLISLVAIVVHFSSTELKSTQKQEQNISAYYIAEAGLERAILEINQSLKAGLEPADVIKDESFEGGSYIVTVTPKTNEKAENIGYTIQSEGTYGDEKEKIIRSVRPTLWTPGTDPLPSAFEYAMFAEEKINVHALPGILGIDNVIENHEIEVNGKIHANQYIEIQHLTLTRAVLEDVLGGLLGNLLGGLLGGVSDLVDQLLEVGDPNINDAVSISGKDPRNKVDIQGFNPNKVIKTEKDIPLPSFDFDFAREQAKKNGFYVPHPNLGISLIGLSPTDKVIFIDGDLTDVGLDLLGIALNGRTLVVNGDMTGLLELGGNEPLNIIANGDIHFLGAVTGLKMNGVLFAHGDITTEGHLEVDGYIGAKNINLGAGVLSNLLGVLTGNMSFTYNKSVFDSLPSDIGFKKESVEVVESGLIPE